MCGQAHKSSANKEYTSTVLVYSKRKIGAKIPSEQNSTATFFSLGQLHRNQNIHIAAFESREKKQVFDQIDQRLKEHVILC